MAQITIDVGYDGFVLYEHNLVYTGYAKVDYGTVLRVGYCFTYVGKSGYYYDHYRTFLKFLLTLLPAGSTVTLVELYVPVSSAQSPAHLTDIHAYDTNGQTDPQLDNAQTCWNRCASGNLYADDSIELQTTGGKWITLGGSVCADVEAAKADPDQIFSLGLHEEGDDTLESRLHAIESEVDKCKLRITYTPPAPPVGPYWWTPHSAI